jgi:predicted transcriptional regulator
MLETNLKNLGLSEKEIAVYLEVLKHGRVGPTQVSKITKINRTTVYSVAKELMKKNEDNGEASDNGMFMYTDGEADYILIPISNETLEKLIKKA